MFLSECAKDLLSMNVTRRPPALYYACPNGKSLDELVEGLQHIGQLGAWHFVALH